MSLSDDETLRSDVQARFDVVLPAIGVEDSRIEWAATWEGYAGAVAGTRLLERPDGSYGLAVHGGGYTVHAGDHPTLDARLGDERFSRSSPSRASRTP